MRGRHEIIVRNMRIQYKFAIERNITILRGDSATGKTTMIEMVAAYQRSGEQSGVTIRADKPCVVLTELNWQMQLSLIHDSIVFIDEGGIFVRRKEFAEAVKNSDNYYVIATRTPLFNLPYSAKEIYGIKNKAGNRYQGTKRLFAEFFPLLHLPNNDFGQPDLVIVEDTNSEYEFFEHYFAKYDIPCISAGGNANVFPALIEKKYTTVLVIADGAAFGAEIERVYNLRWTKNIIIFLPESFEWLVLKSDVLGEHEIREIIDRPYDYIDSKEFFSWERFFTHLLSERSEETFLKYTKARLNPNYLQPEIAEKIERLLPQMDGLSFGDV